MTNWAAVITTILFMIWGFSGGQNEQLFMAWLLFGILSLIMKG